MEQIVRKNLVTLTNKTSRLSEIIRESVSENIISLEEKEQIEAENVTTRMTEQFYILITKKSLKQQHSFVEILKKTGNTDVAKIFVGPKGEIVLSGEPIWFEVAEPSTKFYGREEELKQISDLLHLDTHVSVTTRHRRLVVLAGLGGLGKTQLARKYASIQSDKFNGTVIWIRAESSASLANSFMELAINKLKMDSTEFDSKGNSRELSIEEIVLKVYKFFSENRSLFIFDNCEIYKETKASLRGVYDFLPLAFTDLAQPNISRPFVLLTTRISKLIPDAHEIQLKCFTEQESYDFVRQHLPDDFVVIKEELEELCGLLQHFPHALQQAISYINQQYEVKQRYTLRSYIDTYKSEKARDLLGHEVEFTSEHEYGITTLITWRITLGKIKQNKRDGSLAMRILNYIAYLGPDKIERTLICRFLGMDPDEDDVDGAIKLPFHYSMYTLEKGIISVHRLVQQVIRIDLKEQEGSEDKILDYILGKFYLMLLENLDMNPTILGHLTTAWEHATKYSNLVYEFCQLPLRAAEELKKCSRHAEGLNFATEAMKVLAKTKAVNNDHLTQLKLRQFIGDAQTDMGQYKDAADTLESVLSEARTLIPDKKAFIIAVMHNLARVYGGGFLDKPQKAQSLHQDIIKIQEILNKGKANPLSLTKTRNNQAGELVGMGKYLDALKIYEENYETQVLYLSVDHPDVTTTKNNIAEVLRHLGRYKEATAIHKENVLMQTASVDDTHLLQVTSRNNLALNHLEQGDPDKAMEIFNKSYLVQEQKFGKSHPETLKTYQNIAECWNAKREFSKALEIHTEAFECLKSKYGEKHSTVLHAKNYIGVTHLSAGRPEAALDTFLENMSLELEVFGDSNPNTCRTRNNLAEALKQKGDFKQAQKMHHQNYNIQLNALSIDHPDVIMSRNNLARANKEIGDYNAALKLYKENLAVETQSLGEDHHNVAKTRHNMSYVYIAMENYNDALALQKKNYEIRKRLLGEHHPLTQESKSNVEYLKDKCGTSILQDLHEIYEVNRLTLGENHPITRASRRDYENQ